MRYVKLGCFSLILLAATANASPRSRWLPMNVSAMQRRRWVRSPTILTRVSTRTTRENC